MTDAPIASSEHGSPRPEAASEECARYCPAFHQTIEMVGRRWTGVVLSELSRGELTFTAIKDAIPGLSDRLLSDRLKELESAGVVSRTKRGREVSYALTERGKGLLPILEAVFAFNEEWAGQPIA